MEEFRKASDLKEPPQVKQLQEYVVLDSEAERDTKWVTMLDELPKIVPTAMVSIRFDFFHTSKDFECILFFLLFYPLT